LPSSDPRLTPKEKKKALKKDFNMVKALNKEGKPVLVKEIPECMRHYISARLNPFETPAGACLPSGQFTFPSAKFRSQVAGEFQLGTTGYGYIAFLPAWSNNGNNIVTTTAASVGGVGTAFSAFTNPVYYSFVNLPYPAATFGTPIQGRLVAAGIRISYIGSLMNQNGIAYSYCDADHSSVTNTGTFQNTGNLDDTKRFGITGTVHQGESKRNWAIQCLDNGPVLPTEFNFAAASSVQATPYMIIFVAGLAGDRYEFEVVQHCEMIGSTVANKTPSHTDEIDFPVVDDEIKQKFVTGPPQREDTKGILQSISDGIKDTLPKIMEKIGGAFTSLPTIVKGITSLMPMGGHNPMIPNQGFSYPMLMQSEESKQREQARIKEGRGLGSNLLSAKRDAQIEQFHRYLYEVWGDNIQSKLYVFNQMLTEFEKTHPVPPEVEKEAKTQPEPSFKNWDRELQSVKALQHQWSNCNSNVVDPSQLQNYQRPPNQSDDDDSDSDDDVPDLEPDQYSQLIAAYGPPPDVVPTIFTIGKIRTRHREGGYYRLNPFYEWRESISIHDDPRSAYKYYNYEDKFYFNTFRWRDTPSWDETTEPPNAKTLFPKINTVQRLIYFDDEPLVIPSWTRVYGIHCWLKREVEVAHDLGFRVMRMTPEQKEKVTEILVAEGLTPIEKLPK
jgi:hypothetical protein